MPLWLVASVATCAPATREHSMRRFVASSSPPSLAATGSADPARLTLVPRPLRAPRRQGWLPLPGRNAAPALAAGNHFRPTSLTVGGAPRPFQHPGRNRLRIGPRQPRSAGNSRFPAAPHPPPGSAVPGWLLRSAQVPPACSPLPAPAPPESLPTTPVLKGPPGRPFPV